MHCTIILSKLIFCTHRLAVSGVPQNISATEISPSHNTCTILVTWDPPANRDGSDIDQYIVYVPSRGIRDNISNSSSINLTLSNCGDDIRVLVAAVNRDGCVGMNSSEVLPAPLDIPTAPVITATTTTGACRGNVSISLSVYYHTNCYIPCLQVQSAVL